jgi:hypothetical protein
MLKASRSFANQDGMAVLEMIPVMIVIVVVLKYTYGFFGVIQSATIQSIAVRNYAFETFRHRSRLSYLREVDTLEDRFKYRKGMRLHGVRDENSRASATPDWDVTVRNITFPTKESDILGSSAFLSRIQEQKNITVGRRYSEGDGVNPVWLAIRYGMCIDHKCGEQ